MLGFRNAALAGATACLLIATVSAVDAAGALAVGKCGAFGYGYDFHKVTDARSGRLLRSGRDNDTVLARA